MYAISMDEWGSLLPSNKHSIFGVLQTTKNIPLLLYVYAWEIIEEQNSYFNVHIFFFAVLRTSSMT